MNDPEVLSQADLALLMVGQIDAIGTHISIYLTIISAYLVASYLVGKKLTTPQVSVATAIYIIAYVFEALILAALFRSATVAQQAYRENYSVVSSFVFDGALASAYIGGIIALGILFSSLWFMRSVRQPKEDHRDKDS